MEETAYQTAKFNKTRLVIILIVLLFALIGALWFINGRKSSPAPTAKQPVVTSDVFLLFSPNTLYTKPNQKIFADIVFDAGNTSIESVTVSVSYDPAKIKNAKLTPYKDPNSALSYSLAALPASQTTNKNLSIITYKLVPEAASQKGKGIVAKFEGTLVSAPTDIKFTDLSTAFSDSPNNNLRVGMVNLNILPN